MPHVYEILILDGLLKKSHTTTTHDFGKSLGVNFLYIKNKLCTQEFFHRNIFEVIIFLANFIFFQKLDIFLHLSKYLNKFLST